MLVYSIFSLEPDFFFCSWENHRIYVEAIRELRLKELRCESRMAAVRCGLSSVVPLHVLTVMTPLDMEIRTCGLPSLDLGFLKVCQFYQVAKGGSFLGGQRGYKAISV